MKKNIVKLRLLGILCFLLYLISIMVNPAGTVKNSYTQIQQLLIILAFGSFVVVMGMQLYRFYIKTYLKEEEEDEA